MSLDALFFTSEVLFGGKYPIEAAGVEEIEEELEELEDIWVKGSDKLLM